MTYLSANIASATNIVTVDKITKTKAGWLQIEIS